MLDGYILDEEDRTAARWRTSCASDDALRLQIEARLSEGHLPSVRGVSRSHRGTGGPCRVCGRTIEPTEVEREIGGGGVILHAHEACYVLWRQGSNARRTMGSRSPAR